jgi:hypothetical protein
MLLSVVCLYFSEMENMNLNCHDKIMNKFLKKTYNNTANSMLMVFLILLSKLEGQDKVFYPPQGLSMRGFFLFVS